MSDANDESGSAPGGPLHQDRRAQGILVLAGACIVIASLKLAASLLVPVLLAAFFAMALTPVAMRLQRYHVPAPLAVILSFLLGAVLVLALAGLIAVSMQDVKEKLPEYEARIESSVADATSWLSDKGVDIPEGGIATAINPDQAVTFATSLVASLGSTLSNAIIVLLAMLFMMFETAAITGDVRANRARGSVSDKLQRVMKAVTDYLSVKTVISLFTGLFFGIACALIGVDFPVLLGLLAFLLNYVPNIGSVLAAVPPILVALVQPELGLKGAVLILVANLVVNGILGNVIEPRVMGQKVGLSTLTVFLGLIFWSWVFGPVGTVLSVPLTIVAKMLLEKPAPENEIAPASADTG